MSINMSHIDLQSCECDLNVTWLVSPCLNGRACIFPPVKSRPFFLPTPHEVRASPRSIAANSPLPRPAPHGPLQLVRSEPRILPHRPWSSTALKGGVSLGMAAKT